MGTMLETPLSENSNDMCKKKKCSSLVACNKPNWKKKKNKERVENKLGSSHYNGRMHIDVQRRVSLDSTSMIPIRGALNTPLQCKHKQGLLSMGIKMLQMAFALVGKVLSPLHTL